MWFATQAHCICGLKEIDLDTRKLNYKLECEG